MWIDKLIYHHDSRTHEYRSTGSEWHIKKTYSQLQDQVYLFIRGVLICERVIVQKRRSLFGAVLERIKLGMINADHY